MELLCVMLNQEILIIAGGYEFFSLVALAQSVSINLNKAASETSSTILTDHSEQHVVEQ